MVVHPASHGIPRAPWYSGSSPLASAFVYGILTLCDWISHSIRLASAQLRLSATPKILLPSVWPLPISLATTFGISVDYFSSPYLDVSVQAVPHAYLFDSVYVTTGLLWWVSPFGHPRIVAYLQLPEAFRSLSRPSSAPDAKAFPLRPT